MSLISSAFAGSADAGAAAASGMPNFVLLIVLGLIMYFLLIKPQQKKLKEHRNMVSSLKKGEKIITAGGIIATINKVGKDDNILHVEIAPDVIVQINKDTVAALLGNDKSASNDNAKAKTAAKATKKASNSANSKIQKPRTVKKTPAKKKKVS